MATIIKNGDAATYQKEKREQEIEKERQGFAQARAWKKRLICCCCGGVFDVGFEDFYDISDEFVTNECSLRYYYFNCPCCKRVLVSEEAKLFTQNERDLGRIIHYGDRIVQENKARLAAQQEAQNPAKQKKRSFWRSLFDID